MGAHSSDKRKTPTAARTSPSPQPMGRGVVNLWHVFSTTPIDIFHALMSALGPSMLSIRLRNVFR